MEPDDPRRAKRRALAENMRLVGALSTVGFSFVLAIVMGAGFGVFLMRQFGLGRWAFFLFFFFGLAAGVLNVYRTAGKFMGPTPPRSRAAGPGQPANRSGPPSRDPGQS